MVQLENKIMEENRNIDNDSTSVIHQNLNHKNNSPNNCDVKILISGTTQDDSQTDIDQSYPPMPHSGLDLRNLGASAVKISANPNESGFTRDNLAFIPESSEEDEDTEQVDSVCESPISKTNSMEEELVLDNFRKTHLRELRGLIILNSPEDRIKEDGCVKLFSLSVCNIIFYSSFT